LPVKLPLPEVVNVTVPVIGVTTEDPVSVTVAVHVVGWLKPTGSGVQETEVVVVFCA